MLFCEEFCNGAAHATRKKTLFHGNNLPGLFRSRQDEFPVQRLDGMQVDQTGMDALALEYGGGFCSLAQYRACSHEGDVVPVLHDHSLSDLKRVILVHEHRHLGAAYPDIDRSNMLCCGMNRLDNIHRVTGIDNRHTRNRSEDSSIIQGLMGRAQIRVGQSGTPSHHLHILPHIPEVISEHLKWPCRDKGGNGRDKGDLARCGQTGGIPHDPLLHDSELDVPFRKSFMKRGHPGATRTVRRDGQDIFIFFRCLNQRFTKCFSWVS